MKLLSDFHIHTKDSRFFHGKNSIEELVLQANEMGLKEIAVTDHGYKHLCKTSYQKLLRARRMINEINEWSKTKILLGIEADIIAEDGTLDVDEKTLELIDVLIIGYHRLIKTDFANFFGKVQKTEEAKKKCTNAYLNAIERYPVTIVAHLDSILSTDLYEIGLACAKKGVLVEINNRHTKWNQDQVDDLVASGCSFVVNSDAHRREDVGHVQRCFDIIKKYEIPTENVINVEFEESEKSDVHKEFSLYYEIYQDKIEQIEEKRRAKAQKHQEEFTQTLSTEMEEALAKIAKENGYKYNKNQESEDEEDLSYDEIFSRIHSEDEEDDDDGEDLIRRAQEFLGINTMAEFNAQNEKLDDEETILSDEEQEVRAEEISEYVEEIVPEVKVEAKNMVQNEKPEEPKKEEIIPGMMFAKAPISKKTKVEEKVEVKPEPKTKTSAEKTLNQKKAKSKLNPLAVLDTENLTKTDKK